MISFEDLVLMFNILVPNTTIEGANKKIQFIQHFAFTLDSDWGGKLSSSAFPNKFSGMKNFLSQSNGNCPIVVPNLVNSLKASPNYTVQSGFTHANTLDPKKLPLCVICLKILSGAALQLLRLDVMPFLPSLEL